METTDDNAPLKPFEPPRVKYIGNARDLLHGATGSVVDMNPQDPQDSRQGE
jgi:hypothetical protein